MPIASEDPWLRRFHPKPRATRRLVCFPHAGGGASYWYGLSRAAGPDLDVLVVQYPGREDRLLEEPLDDLHAVADGAFEALRPRLDGHTAFLGHSMGAIVAFEVARRAEAQSGPCLLIASACEAPSRVRRDWGEADRDDETLFAALSELGGTAAVTDPELLSMIMPAVRADLRAVERYASSRSAVVNTPVVALLGEQDAHVDREQAHDWAHHTTADFALRSLPGGHFYPTADIGRFATTITDCMARFQG
ncbi:thioesterase II family protein [Streptomyces sp. NPDC002181]|uniref:thioesterase II family protein n=1 Tax=Streptomyces sp. NPDC002181 TaxID=3364635 RepID=UPI0036C0F176